MPTAKSKKTVKPAKKAPAKKVPAKKTPAKKAPAKKAPAKKAPAKKTVKPAKKVPTKKAPAKKAPTKKAPAKKVPAKKPIAKVAVKSADNKASQAKSGQAKVAPAKTAPVKASPTKAAKPEPKRPPKPPVFVKPPVPGKRPVSKDGIISNKDFDLTFLRAQRQLLIDKRSEYLGLAEKLERERQQLIEESAMGDDQFDEDGGEGDNIAVERERAKVLSEQDRQIVADIDAALARIASGDYGYSVVSTKPIPRERLEFIPWATELVSERVGGIGQR